MHCRKLTHQTTIYLGHCFLRFLALELVVSCLFILSACKHAASDSKVNADFIDGQPSDSETWTEARTISLNKYAKDLINYDGNERKTHNELQLQVDEAFKAADVTGARPLSVYTVKLGPLDECFGEGGQDFGMWWNRNRNQIRAQIEQVSYFVRDVHIKMLGQTRGAFSFREVIICPEEKIGAKMRLDGYQLRIGVPYTSFGNYQPIPNNAGVGQVSLNSLWQAGAPIGLDRFEESWWNDLRSMFDKKEKAREALSIAWRMLNPLSAIRVSIRKILHESGSDLSRKIAALLKTLPNEPTQTGLRQALLDELIGEQSAEPSSGILVNQKQLPDDTMALFNKLNDAETKLFAENWACAASDTERRSDVESEATSVMQREMRNEKNYIKKNVRAGLVAVVNHHRVGVNIQGTSGAYARYMPVETNRETRITTDVRAGLVAVDTSDDISVDLNFSINVGTTMPTMAFDVAVRAAAANRRLCH